MNLSTYVAQLKGNRLEMVVVAFCLLGEKEIERGRV